MKTVKDVVKEYPDGLPNINHLKHDIIGYNYKVRSFFAGHSSHWCIGKCEYKVCTIEEYEKELDSVNKNDSVTKNDSVGKMEKLLDFIIMYQVEISIVTLWCILGGIVSYFATVAI